MFSGFERCQVIPEDTMTKAIRIIAVLISTIAVLVLAPAARRDRILW